MASPLYMPYWHLRLAGSVPSVLERILTVVALFWCAAGAFGDDRPEDPILRIQTTMYTAFMKAIAVDCLNERLMSVSDDKTARFRDLRTGRLPQTMRVPAEFAHEGRLYAVAISPDGKTAAMSGWTGWDRNFSIYLSDN